MRGLLLRERIELARLGRDEEARLDDVGVGHAAPQPLEQIAALGRDFARPLASGIAGPSQAATLAIALALASLSRFCIERAVDRERLDQRRSYLRGA